MFNKLNQHIEANNVLAPEQFLDLERYRPTIEIINFYIH
jgi:hypothetical protein